MSVYVRYAIGSCKDPYEFFFSRICVKVCVDGPTAETEPDNLQVTWLKTSSAAKNRTHCEMECDKLALGPLSQDSPRQR